MNSQPTRTVDKDKQALFDQVIGAIQASGWNVLYAAPIDNPLHIIMQHDDLSYPLTVYIWKVTHGGGVRRPEGEYRIQLTGVPVISVAGEGKTLLLGWWGDEGVFAGFDARRHVGPTRSQSIQIGRDALLRAKDNGLVSYNKGNGEVAYAIRPDMLTTYIQELSILHEIGERPEEVKVLDTPIDDVEQEETILKEVSEPRREVVRSIRKKLRNERFRTNVLTAYRSACTMCSIQMELVEAAHIVPVAHQGSRDVVTNGIALCVLHHHAFDRGIVTCHPEDGVYRVALNVKEIARLKGLNLSQGYDNFKSQLPSAMRLPRSNQYYPDPQNVALGNHLRGWAEEDFTNPEVVEFIA